MTNIPKNALRLALSSAMRSSKLRDRSTKTRSSPPQVEAYISEFQEDWVLLGTPATDKKLFSRKLSVNFSFPIIATLAHYATDRHRQIPRWIMILFFAGVGIATMVMVTYYNVYYCVIVAWSLYYFVASFVSIPDLPWNTCGKKFAHFQVTCLLLKRYLLCCFRHMGSFVCIIT